MAKAKRGKTLKKSTKAKMSATHSRRGDLHHTPETRALLSAKLKGRRPTAAHRAAISSGLRRRHAAVRVLAAVEDVHRELTVAKHTGPGSSSYESAAKRSGGGKTPSRNQLMNSYKAQLREYRNLQEELQPWTTAFTTKEGRKPTLEDVEATNIEWLIVRYKQYILLRDQLLRAIPAFRSKADGDKSPTGGAAGADRQAASTFIAEEAAARVKAAMEYRQRQQGSASASTSADGEESGEGNSVREIPTAGVGTDARVSDALQAALDYRQNKAKLASAKAKAAATMAGGANSPKKPPSVQ
ncbi:uncharacterized protein LOC142355534 [Convolutriloba macropyga]|uniref:uncharacterized protein LOC142355534 n=1 Tax=Convolutriloba macropyga TaxID=536237 RepID=UPI003F5282E4